MISKSKRGKSGALKSAYQMKVFYKPCPKYPKGGVFTYRGDHQIPKLKELYNVKATNELKALQFLFAKNRHNITKATIFDNSIPYPTPNKIFLYENGKYIIDNLDWELPTTNNNAKPSKQKT